MLDGAIGLRRNVSNEIEENTMSYNITSMKVSKVSLRLQLHFDFMEWITDQPARDERGYENIGRRWLLEDPVAISANLAEGAWQLSLFGEDDKVIKGIIEDGALVATALEDWEGDGSGYLYEDVLFATLQRIQRLTGSHCCLGRR